jgi:hypothetical protein
MATGSSADGRTVTFNFRIKEYTSNEDVQKYVKMLKESGQDALQSALDKLDVGRIYPTESIGNQIAISKMRQSGNNTIITIVTVRVIGFLELYRGGCALDYPFGFMQVTLDKDGKEMVDKNNYPRFLKMLPVSDQSLLLINCFT